MLWGKPFPVVRLFVYPSLWRTSCDSANNSGCKNLFLGERSIQRNSDLKWHHLLSHLYLPVVDLLPTVSWVILVELERIIPLSVHESASCVIMSVPAMWSRLCTFTFMHLADAFIQSDLQLHSGYTFSLVCVFPGNRTHNLLRCWRNALPLSHTGTQEGVRTGSTNLGPH